MIAPPRRPSSANCHPERQRHSVGAPRGNPTHQSIMMFVKGSHWGCTAFSARGIHPTTTRTREHTKFSLLLTQQSLILTPLGSRTLAWFDQFFPVTGHSNFLHVYRALALLGSGPCSDALVASFHQPTFSRVLIICSRNRLLTKRNSSKVTFSSKRLIFSRVLKLMISTSA